MRDPKVTRVPWLPAGAMAIHPFILLHRSCHATGGLLAHERLHCQRQAEAGVLRWLWKYLTDTRFRYREELLGFRRELDVGDPLDRAARAEAMARSLATCYHMRLDVGQVTQDLLKPG